ncbi:MAG: hypothetical protein K6U14_08185 [Firmicutes bacterium]|nr:hypothetical protein [Alicyclobacillaceae bacterium]MCL6497592.1 hypothetical protein [Bacillota bacterium]
MTQIGWDGAIPAKYLTVLGKRAVGLVRSTGTPAVAACGAADKASTKEPPPLPSAEMTAPARRFAEVGRIKQGRHLIARLSSVADHHGLGQGLRQRRLQGLG